MQQDTITRAGKGATPTRRCFTKSFKNSSRGTWRITNIQIKHRRDHHSLKARLRSTLHRAGIYRNVCRCIGSVDDAAASSNEEKLETLEGIDLSMAHGGSARTSWERNCICCAAWVCRNSHAGSIQNNHVHWDRFCLYVVPSRVCRKQAGKV